MRPPGPLRLQQIAGAGPALPEFVPSPFAIQARANRSSKVLFSSPAISGAIQMQSTTHETEQVDHLREEGHFWSIEPEFRSKSVNKKRALPIYALRAVRIYILIEISYSPVTHGLVI